MAPKHDLVLFYFPECPFCQKVLRAKDELGIDLKLRNINEDQSAKEKLIADTGRKTVPCLYIDGNPMHESDDIVNWLNEHYGP